MRACIPAKGAAHPLCQAVGVMNGAAHCASALWTCLALLQMGTVLSEVQEYKSCHWCLGPTRQTGRAAVGSLLNRSKAGQHTCGALSGGKSALAKLNCSGKRVHVLLHLGVSVQQHCLPQVCSPNF